MHHASTSSALLFKGAELRSPNRTGEPLVDRPFGAGDRLFALDRIDPRYARDPLFDAVEEIDDCARLFSKRTAALVASLMACAVTACGRGRLEPHASDAILLQLKPGAAAPTQRQAAAGPPIQPLLDLAGDGEEPLLRVPVPPGMTPEEFARSAADDDAVQFAEPVYVYRASKASNDPRLRDLWGLSAIEAQAAWDTTTGDRNVIAAIVDDGMSLTHADLSANLWVNPEEIAGNGRDDDGDGFVDDVHGYDFVDADGEPAPAAKGSMRWHGTHVAGTIGAAGDNGKGVAGVAWNVSLMAVRGLGPLGGRADDLARAIDYAVDHGARVINASWGGGGPSRAIAKAVERAGRRGALFVAAAGNGGAEEPEFPASLDLANVISVGAHDAARELAIFSSRGAHVAAPGLAILSTTAPGRYERYDGTSMAAPHVSGIAALLWSRHPSASVGQVRKAILESGRPLDGTLHGTVSAARALAVLDRDVVEEAGVRLSRTALEFTATSERPPRAQVISIRSNAGGATNWTAQADRPWIHLPRTEGVTPQRFTVRIDPTKLAPGVHEGKVSIRVVDGAGHASDPATLTVIVRIDPEAALALAGGAHCSVSDGVVRVRAGAICRITAPGLDGRLRNTRVAWTLPDGLRVAGGTLSARFNRPGLYSLTVSSSDEGDDRVAVQVE